MASSTGPARRCARWWTGSLPKKLPDNAEQRPPLRRRGKERASRAQRLIQAPVERSVVLSLREEARERRVVGDGVVGRIIAPQHADVARHARGDDRRADARGLA